MAELSRAEKSRSPVRRASRSSHALRSSVVKIGETQNLLDSAHRTIKDAKDKFKKDPCDSCKTDVLLEETELLCKLACQGASRALSLAISLRPWDFRYEVEESPKDDVVQSVCTSDDVLLGEVDPAIAGTGIFPKSAWLAGLPPPPPPPRQAAFQVVQEGKRGVIGKASASVPKQHF